MTHQAEQSGQPASGLLRRLSLPGLAATGICAMLGASVYVVPAVSGRIEVQQK